MSCWVKSKPISRWQKCRLALIRSNAIHLFQKCLQSSRGALKQPIMKVDGKNLRTIWLDPDDEKTVKIIDQRRLPHELYWSISTVDDVITAIKDMYVRGAPLIGEPGLTEFIWPP